MNDLLLLQNLKVLNFRSIKNQTFDLDDFSVLIGKNNSGKTNILDAIEILLEGTAKSIQDSDCSVACT